MSCAAVFSAGCHCGFSVQVQLERIIGLSASHNNALSISPTTGDVAYPAGCMVCLYNAKRNKQVRSNRCHTCSMHDSQSLQIRLIRSSAAVTCVAFSPDGQHIAIGVVRGQRFGGVSLLA
jgi:WD40 repeat protein